MSVVARTRIVTLATPSFFFFNDTATTEIYTLSLHDALPISRARLKPEGPDDPSVVREESRRHDAVGNLDADATHRSEEHTSELQSRPHLVCRLLLEKKKMGFGSCGAQRILSRRCVRLGNCWR